jgi:hypothetical protein
MVTFDEAIEVSGVTAHALNQIVESGLVQLKESPSGEFLICLNSLTAFNSERRSMP